MRRIFLALLVTACLLAGRPARAEESDNGSRVVYLRYCGACHGPGGRGDGVAGTFMRPKPTDLTQIAKQNGGEFPTLRVMEIIDGRKTLRAHGDPDMPVWGEILGEQAASDTTRRAEVQGRLMAITDHLRSIQQK